MPDLYIAPVGTVTGGGDWSWVGTCGTSTIVTSTTSAIAYITSSYGYTVGAAGNGGSSGIGGGGGGSGSFEFDMTGGATNEFVEFMSGGSAGGGGGVSVPSWSQQELEREREERERERAAARAERLLLSFLTPEQARSYVADGFFLVTGSAGGRWRIRREGYMGNVDLLDEDGRQVAWYCIHPPGSLPDADAHLAQMLHLVTDEESFRAIGNAHPVVSSGPVNLGPRRIAPADDAPAAVRAIEEDLEQMRQCAA